MTKNKEIDNEEMQYIVRQAKLVVGGIILLIFISTSIYFIYGS